MLLDPANKNDPKLMTFDEQGLPIPSAPENPIVRKRVETTVHFLHLDQERLVRARKQKWRETLDWTQEYLEACPTDYGSCTLRDHERLQRLTERLTEMTGPESSYAATARACLRANGLDWLVKTPEEASVA